MIQCQQRCPRTSLEIGATFTEAEPSGDQHKYLNSRNKIERKFEVWSFRAFEQDIPAMTYCCQLLPNACRSLGQKCITRAVKMQPVNLCQNARPCCILRFPQIMRENSRKLSDGEEAKDLRLRGRVPVLGIRASHFMLQNSEITCCGLAVFAYF